MSDGGFNISPDEIRNQAKGLEGIGDKISEVGDKAHGISIPWSTYGLIGRPFAAALEFVYREVGDGIKAFGHITGKSSEQLHKAAEVIDGHDDAASKSIGEAGQGMPQ